MSKLPTPCVFERHGVTANRAAKACWLREYADVSGESVLMTKSDHIAADAWYEAHERALAACYQGKPPSEAAQIKLVTVSPAIEVWKP